MCTVLRIKVGTVGFGEAVVIKKNIIRCTGIVEGMMDHRIFQQPRIAAFNSQSYAGSLPFNLDSSDNQDNAFTWTSIFIFYSYLL